MLVLNEKDLKELNDFIQELPVKYGLPLLQFINTRIAEQKINSPEKAPVETESKSE